MALFGKKNQIQYSPDMFGENFDFSIYSDDQLKQIGKARAKYEANQAKQKSAADLRQSRQDYVAGKTDVNPDAKKASTDNSATD